MIWRSEDFEARETCTVVEAGSKEFTFERNLN